MFHSLFPVLVYEHVYTGDLLQKIQAEIQQEYDIQNQNGFIHIKKEEKSRIGSLYITSGALASTDNINNFINDDSKFPVFKKEIFENVISYCKKTNIEIEIDPFIRRSWFVVTHSGNASSIHTHLWEDIIVVYYFKADGDEGNIRLHSPHNKIKYTKDNTKEIVPTSGKMIIFPGWLAHEVLANNTEKERVSISVNIKVFEDYKYERP